MTQLRDEGQIQLVDIQKSYATFHTAPCYEGLPGRFTFMYTTDSYEHGPGFYYIEKIDWSGADPKLYSEKYANALASRSDPATCTHARCYGSSSRAACDSKSPVVYGRWATTRPSICVFHRN